MEFEDPAQCLPLSLVFLHVAGFSCGRAKKIWVSGISAVSVNGEFIHPKTGFFLIWECDLPRCADGECPVMVHLIKGVKMQHLFHIYTCIVRNIYIYRNPHISSKSVFTLQWLKDHMHFRMVFDAGRKLCEEFPRKSVDWISSSPRVFLAFSWCSLPQNVTSSRVGFQGDLSDFMDFLIIDWRMFSFHIEKCWDFLDINWPKKLGDSCWASPWAMATAPMVGIEAVRACMSGLKARWDARIWLIWPSKRVN